MFHDLEPSNLDIVLISSSNSVRIGSTVLLVCIAVSYPRNASIKWQFKGIEISNCSLCKVCKVQ